MKAIAETLDSAASDSWGVRREEAIATAEWALAEASAWLAQQLVAGKKLIVVRTADTFTIESF